MIFEENPIIKEIKETKKDEDINNGELIKIGMKLSALALLCCVAILYYLKG